MLSKIVLLLGLVSLTIASASTTAASSSHETVLGIFRKDCLDLLLNNHTTTGECLKFTISKGLGMGIIIGSFLYKIPQITKIIKAGSVEGILLSSFYTQLLMILNVISYNIHIGNPLINFGESVSVGFQTVFLIILHWYFNPKTSKACVVASIATFAGIGYVLLGGILPHSFYNVIGSINIALVFISIVPQIFANFKNKSSGQLAFLTIFFAFFGNAARIFTTLQDTNDPLLLAMYIAMASCQAIVLLQILMYKGAKPKTKKE